VQKHFLEVQHLATAARSWIPQQLIGKGMKRLKGEGNREREGEREGGKERGREGGRE